MTYSIVARDPSAGELGIAVQSRHFAVGRFVPFAESGVGVVASQAFPIPAHGPEALRLLHAGLEPNAVLERLLSDDPGGATRQIAILDARGRMAVHTGAGCVSAAGHAIAANCCTQANMMTRDTVWPAMVRAFDRANGPLADRLVAAMDAAEREGGDLRGRQAAALIVVSDRPEASAPLDRSVDLRIDDHPDPVGEIRRLLEYSRAHERANRAIERIRTNDVAGALADLDDACSAHPNEPEFLVRRALVLFRLGRVDAARADLRNASVVNAGWVELVLRFADAGIVPVRRADLAPLVAELRRDAVAPAANPRQELRPAVGTPPA